MLPYDYGRRLFDATPYYSGHHFDAISHDRISVF